MTQFPYLQSESVWLLQCMESLVETNRWAAVTCLCLLHQLCIGRFILLCTAYVHLGGDGVPISCTGYMTNLVYSFLWEIKLLDLWSLKGDKVTILQVKLGWGGGGGGSRSVQLYCTCDCKFVTFTIQTNLYLIRMKYQSLNRIKVLRVMRRIFYELLLKKTLQS